MTSSWITRFLLSFLLLGASSAHTSFAAPPQSPSKPNPPAPPQAEETPEPVASEAQLAPVLSRTKTACLRKRREFVKKYPAVDEKPEATCDCVIKAVRAQKSLLLAKESEIFYTAKGLKDLYPPSRDYLATAEENCRADAKWVTGRLRPENFEQRMREIDEQMNKGRH